jgi:hypothetical protein
VSGAKAGITGRGGVSAEFASAGERSRRGHSVTVHAAETSINNPGGAPIIT